MAVADFTAYLIDKSGDKVGGRLTTMSAAQLDDGEVTIRVHYSSINYKDALAATGAGKIIRRFPCVGGIDLAGEVVESTDARFRPGDPVIATSFDLGVCTWRYAQYARVGRLGAAVALRVEPVRDNGAGNRGLHAAMAGGWGMRRRRAARSSSPAPPGASEDWRSTCCRDSATKSSR